MEHARTATPADIGRLAELARELRAELATYRGGALWGARDVHGEPLEARLATVLEHPGAAVFAGTFDDVVVGYGIIELETLRDGSRLGVVSELFVEPDARGVGVGEALANAIVDHCRSAECRGVDVVALPGHRATKNFFEAHGFVARAIVMHHELDAGARGSDEA
jgi:phosphinothricin acetyltransferase